MSKVFILLFLIYVKTIATDISECKIIAVGGVIEEKDNNPYFTFQNKEKNETYFSIGAMHLDNCPLSVAEILEKEIEINQNDFQIKKDRECEIEGYLSVKKNLKKAKLHLSSVNYLFKLKAKYKIDNNYIKTKFSLAMQIKGDYWSSNTKNNYKFKNRTEYTEYITQVLAKIENRTVFNVWLSRNFPKSIFFKFKSKSFKHNNSVEIITINNKGLKRKQTIPIKKLKITTPTIVKESKVDIDTDRFKSDTVDNAIQKLYGSINNPIKEGLNLIIPEPSIHCQLRIPIHIKSNKDLESIAFFTDKTTTPVVAFFSIPPNGIIDYKFNIYIPAYGNCIFTVIGKGRDGKIYKTVKKSLLSHSYDGCL